MALESFHAYYSYLESIEPLDDAERGRLFTALLMYAKDGTIPELTGSERILFPTMKGQIDRDKAKYAEKCRKNAANVSNRWNNTNDYDGIQTNTTVYDGTSSYTNDTKNKDKDKDKEKNNIYPLVVEEAFEKFWSVYPKKVGKIDAKKKFAKVAVDVDTLIAAVEKQKNSTQWTKNDGQFIPNPSTWLNQERWNDELEVKENRHFYTIPYEPSEYDVYDNR